MQIFVTEKTWHNKEWEFLNLLHSTGFVNNQELWVAPQCEENFGITDHKKENFKISSICYFRLLSMSGKSSLTSTKDYFQGKKWEKKRLT
jgi:hypothetical protein